MRICEYVRCKPWIHDLREDHKGMVYARLQPSSSSKEGGSRRKFYQRCTKYTHPKLFSVRAVYDATINISISGYTIVTVTRRINYPSFLSDESSQRKYDNIDYTALHESIIRIWFDSPNYHIRAYLSICELAVCLYCRRLVRK